MSSGELDYMAMKMGNESRIADEQRAEKDRISLLVLILGHLEGQGYANSLESLEIESGVSLNKYQVCDNIDLLSIMQEFTSYYAIKFNKQPKLTKKIKEVATKGHELRTGRTRGRPRQQSAPNSTRKSNTPITPTNGRKPVTPVLPPTSKQPNNKRVRPKRNTKDSNAARPSSTPSSNDGFNVGIGVSGTGLTEEPKSLNAPRKGPPAMIDLRQEIRNATKLPNGDRSNDNVDASDRLLKPITQFGYNSEMRDLAAVISRDIYLQSSGVSWKDIIGLDRAQRLLKEAVVYPIRYPQLYQGIRSPWKGLLLYGPPGTGKTMLAKAVAAECNTTFFNISASSIVSKWRGDSEKLVRILFELARYHSPSTIFLDELDAIMSTRSSGGGSSEHEGSRRMKTELLVQMDGLAKSDDLVFVLAASNIPWELDPAMLRRLEKRILVGLPSAAGREAMVKHFLPPPSDDPKTPTAIEANVNYSLIAEKSEGYSGSDIKLVCKEAAMRPLREVFRTLESDLPDPSQPLKLKIDAVQTEDLLKTLETTKPSASQLEEQYASWEKQYGSV